MKKWVAMVLLSLVLAPLAANFLQWDPAGTNAGELGGLNIAQSIVLQLPPANYQKRETDKDGFLGRLVLPRGSGNVLTFTTGLLGKRKRIGNYSITSDNSSSRGAEFHVGTVKSPGS